MTAFGIVSALIIVYVMCWVAELLFAPPESRIKILKEATLCVLIVVMFFVLVGCAPSQPLTQADLLARQVKVEKMQRACNNAGGIWYGTVRSGRCDWTPLL